MPCGGHVSEGVYDCSLDRRLNHLSLNHLRFDQGYVLANLCALAYPCATRAKTKKNNIDWEVLLGRSTNSGNT
eukprot:4279735-Amphidinium_carterae.1